MHAPVESANKSVQSPSRQVKTVDCKTSISPPNSIQAIVTIAAVLYGKSRLLCFLIMPLHHKTTSKKKKPLCTSLSKPGKNMGSLLTSSLILMVHITKTNKAHKIVSL